MQVFQTAGVPPSSGSTILAIIGCTRNSNDELRNSVQMNSRIICGVLRTRANAMPWTAREPELRRHEDTKKRNGFLRVFVSSWLPMTVADCNSGSAHTML